MTMAVMTDRLGFDYGSGAPALHECSVEIPSGSVVGLVGSNGAGKSTLLRVLAGQLAPTRGSVRVGGVDPRTSADRRGEHERVRFVTQQRPLYNSLTPLEMLDFGRRTNRFWDGRLALGWLEAFDVPLTRACRTLSGGQRAQVTLALALGARAAVLLLDEPLAELDAAVRADVTGGLLSISADRGMTIVLSTHAIAELGGVVDHLVLLGDGRLILAGDVDDIVSTHLLCTGPAGDPIPYPGMPVHVSVTARQVTAVLRTAPERPTPQIEPSGWRTAPMALDEVVMAYLRADVASNRAARLDAALGGAA